MSANVEVVKYNASVKTPAGWRHVVFTANAIRTSPKRVTIVTVNEIDGEKVSHNMSRTGANRQKFNGLYFAGQEAGKTKNIRLTRYTSPAIVTPHRSNSAAATGEKIMLRTINESENSKLTRESFAKGVVFAVQASGVRMLAVNPDTNDLRTVCNFGMDLVASVKPSAPKGFGSGWIGTATLNKRGMKFAYSQLLSAMNAGPSCGGRG